MTRTAAAERGIAHDATRLQERRAVGARALTPAAVADGNQDGDGDRRAGGEGRRLQADRQTDRQKGRRADRPLLAGSSRACLQTTDTDDNSDDGRAGAGKARQRIS